MNKLMVFGLVSTMMLFSCQNSVSDIDEDIDNGGGNNNSQQEWLSGNLDASQKREGKKATKFNSEGFPVSVNETNGSGFDFKKVYRFIKSEDTRNQWLYYVVKDQVVRQGELIVSMRYQYSGEVYHDKNRTTSYNPENGTINDNFEKINDKLWAINVHKQGTAQQKFGYYEDNGKYITDAAFLSAFRLGTGTVKNGSETGGLLFSDVRYPSNGSFSYYKTLGRDDENGPSPSVEFYVIDPPIIVGLGHDNADINKNFYREMDFIKSSYPFFNTLIMLNEQKKLKDKNVNINNYLNGFEYRKLYPYRYGNPNGSFFREYAYYTDDKGRLTGMLITEKTYDSYYGLRVTYYYDHFVY